MIPEAPLTPLPLLRDNPFPVRTVTSNPQFRVYDEVVEAQAFSELTLLLAKAQFEKVHQPGRGYAWRREDGEPEATSNCFHDGAAPWAASLFEVLLAQAEALRPLVGTQGQDWGVVSARAFRHGAGSGLSWHTDDPGYTGAWIFFAHPAWDCHWGGELLVADPSCQGRQWREPKPPKDLAPKAREALKIRAENALLAEVGVGHYLFPKPNRLVVIAGGHAHRVSPVTPGAGGHARTTLSGFFLRV